LILRIRTTLATVLLAGGVSFLVTYGVHAFRAPVAATSPTFNDPFDELGLSADQKKKIHAIAMAHHPRLVGLQATVDDSRRNLARILAAPGPLDEAAMTRALQEVARLESDLDLEVARNLIELRPLLSEVQQRTLFQHIQLRHPRNRPDDGDRP
jgi:uncharacterized membrane protein